MIRVLSHDPAWIAMFETESRRIARAACGAVVRMHHIGSTSIPQTRAKPVIDILLEVVSLERIDASTPLLEQIGYQALGEFGIAGRRYFRRDDSRGVRTHQVHAFEVGVDNVVRHIALRDYLRAHRAIAEEYGALKASLAAAHGDDMAAYIAGKSAFVQEHEQRALRWVARVGGYPRA